MRQVHLEIIRYASVSFLCDIVGCDFRTALLYFNFNFSGCNAVGVSSESQFSGLIFDGTNADYDFTGKDFLIVTGK